MEKIKKIFKSILLLFPHLFGKLKMIIKNAVHKPRLVITYDDDTQFFLIVSNRPKVKVKYVTQQQLTTYVNYLLKEEE